MYRDIERARWIVVGVFVVAVLCAAALAYWTGKPAPTAEIGCHCELAEVQRAVASGVGLFQRLADNFFRRGIQWIESDCGIHLLKGKASFIIVPGGEYPHLRQVGFALDVPIREGQYVCIHLEQEGDARPVWEYRVYIEDRTYMASFSDWGPQGGCIQYIQLRGTVGRLVRVVLATRSAGAGGAVRVWPKVTIEDENIYPPGAAFW